MLLDGTGRQDWDGPQQKLCRRRGSTTQSRPSWALVLAWQGPLMFLSYSLVIFLIGLTTYVISPVARKREWDDDAKVGRPHNPVAQACQLLTTPDPRVLCCGNHCCPRGFRNFLPFDSLHFVLSRQVLDKEESYWPDCRT